MPSVPFALLAVSPCALGGLGARRLPARSALHGCVMQERAHGNAAEPGPAGLYMPLAPPMTIEKYETMQRRRVQATLEFTMHPSWRFWAEQAAEVLAILKERHPDLVVQKVIVATMDSSQIPDMALRVEGKLCARLSSGRGAVYLPMQLIGIAVEEGRRTQRPAENVYGAREQ
ncbi:hypothetical protein AB1Y20_021430 [Prymnesium parvum]|uniref:Uncharacterized protein n=1 Tax=Prymnesium parvum TaxID=97485 RepID=A0AB34JLJ9_PRYPA